MGIDGFSMRNLGMREDKLSLHHAIEADDTAQRAFGEQAETLDASIGQRKIGRKEDDYGEDKSNQSFSGGDTSTSGSDTETKDKDEVCEEDEDDDEEDERRFVVKENEVSSLIELQDTEEEKILESLSLEDLSDLAVRLDNPAGILVNKKI